MPVVNPAAPSLDRKSVFVDLVVAGKLVTGGAGLDARAATKLRENVERATNLQCTARALQEDLKRTVGELAKCANETRVCADLLFDHFGTSCADEIDVEIENRKPVQVVA